MVDADNPSKQEVARNLKKLGIQVQTIAQATGLL